MTSYRENTEAQQTSKVMHCKQWHMTARLQDDKLLVDTEVQQTSKVTHCKPWHMTAKLHEDKLLGEHGGSKAKQRHASQSMAHDSQAAR